MAQPNLPGGGPGYPTGPVQPGAGNYPTSPATSNYGYGQPPAGYNQQPGYPQPNGGYGQPPAQQADLSWLTTSLKTERAWIFPLASLLMLIGNIIAASSQAVSSPGAQVVTVAVGFLFFTVGLSVLAFVLTRGFINYRKATKSIATLALAALLLQFLVIMVMCIVIYTKIDSFWVYELVGAYQSDELKKSVTVMLIFAVILFVIVAVGALLGFCLPRKNRPGVSGQFDALSPLVPAFLAVFFLLYFTGHYILIILASLLLILLPLFVNRAENRVKYTILGIQGLLVLVNFIMALASQRAQLFYHNTLHPSLALTSFTWVYWVVGVICWILAAVIFLYSLYALYLFFSKRPIVDLFDLVGLSNSPAGYPGVPGPYQQTPNFGPYPGGPVPGQNGPIPGGMPAMPMPPAPMGQAPVGQMSMGQAPAMSTPPAPMPPAPMGQAPTMPMPANQMPPAPMSQTHPGMQPPAPNAPRAPQAGFPSASQRPAGSSTPSGLGGSAVPSAGPANPSASPTGLPSSYADNQASDADLDELDQTRAITPEDIERLKAESAKDTDQ